MALAGLWWVVSAFILAVVDMGRVPWMRSRFTYLALSCNLLSRALYLPIVLTLFKARMGVLVWCLEE